ncbi:PucR family transcriptional regulator [Sinomonas sp. JGH33]|uniref:PucR family transcriptional regulator n=1 Tax=Sinomonas terricola TaxID=3110330 RepID=A0ABU5TCR6_9MICC|nr:PucR family transcriptional regulator [Sinomonas sp. JGH33]MEA5457241.1 PucR family transcriptional regulator [Sinomonas sp. JGH33]
MWPSDPDGLPAAEGISLSSFLARLPAGVRVLHDAGDSPLRWVDPNEVADPTPYLVEHEMLLTSGMPFRADDGVDFDVFVRRLVAGRASGLGCGLEPHFHAVPEALVEACRKYGLTLWEIPPGIPFAALGMTFARLLEFQNAIMLRDVAEASRQLLRAILGTRPEQDLMDCLARLSGARFELYGPRGQLRFSAAGRSAVGPADVELVGGLVRKTLEGSGSRVERLAAHGAVMASFPLRSQVPGRHENRRREATLGALVATHSQELSAVEHTIASTAVGLLEVLARERTAGSVSPGQLATAVLLGIDLDGNAAMAERLLAESVGGSRRAPVRVVVGTALPGVSHSFASSNSEVVQWSRLWETGLVLKDAGRLYAITRLQPTDAVLSAAVNAGYAVAVSGPSGAKAFGAASADLGRLREHAEAYVARAKEGRKAVRVEDSAPTLLGLLSPEAGAMLAHEIFSPLAQLGSERESLLLRVLAAWLDANGSWDTASSALGLHRNSVRRHIATLADLLGRDLRDAGVRAELWTALRFLPQGRRP